MKKVTKSDLIKRIESLEGSLLALEETVEFLKRDIHESRNPYKKVGSPEWQDYAKKLVKQINIYT